MRVLSCVPPARGGAQRALDAWPNRAFSARARARRPCAVAASSPTPTGALQAAVCRFFGTFRARGGRRGLRTGRADAEDGILHVGLRLQHVFHAQLGARDRILGPPVLQLVPQAVACRARARAQPRPGARAACRARQSGRARGSAATRRAPPARSGLHERAARRRARARGAAGRTVVGDEVLAVGLVDLEAQQHADVARVAERRHKRLARVRRVHGHDDVEVGPHAVEARGALPLEAPAVGVVVAVPGGRRDGPAGQRASARPARPRRGLLPERRRRPLRAQRQPSATCDDAECL